jgi:hypothetical protein
LKTIPASPFRRPTRCQIGTQKATGKGRRGGFHKDSTADAAMPGGFPA